jgi:uncharacterized DUF497 family protein
VGSFFFVPSGVLRSHFKINKKKHGVSFEEAKSVFYDDQGIQFWDEEHSDTEERYLLLGRSSKMRILLIVHSYQE